MSSTTPQGPGGPEYLESGGGAPVAPERASGRRPVLIGGAVFGGLALAGGAAWAAASFFATGAQPAQALPASTLAYASVDLDPSGSQKMEAISMLQKFPAFKEEIGLDADDDIRRRLFDEVVESGECEGLDYAADVEPWLGNRAAVAAVDTGAEQPTPVVVLQVTDGGAAEEGLTSLRETCGGDAGWVIEGDWALVAEDEKTAAGVADAAAEGSLADDETYQRWTDAAGEAGVASGYAAPAAGTFLAESLAGPGFGMGGEPMSGSEVPEDVEAALADFGGMAATVRFDDGGLELELAGDAGKQGDSLGTEGGVEALSTLPADTIAAVGMNLADGWFANMAEQMAAASGGEMTKEDLFTELSNQTGLALPEDVETLTGESLAIALGSGFDPESFVNSTDPSSLPLGLKVKGDPEAIEGVLDKLRASMGPMGTMLASQAEGDFVVVSPNEDYRTELAGTGSLGDSAAFQSVVEEADRASAVVFVDFDAGDNWLAELAADDPKAKENIEPLSAFGVSAWRDGEASHTVVRLTTD